MSVDEEVIELEEAPVVAAAVPTESAPEETMNCIPTITTTTDEEAVVPVPSTTEQEEEKKKVAYPIIRHTDVPEENKPDIMEIIKAAVEKHGSDYDLVCKQIKEDMDKQYGPHWHAVVGECFGFEITHQNHHIMYLYHKGNLGILVWKNNN